MITLPVSTDWGSVAGIMAGFIAVGTGLGTIFMFVTRSVVREEIKSLDNVYLRKDLAESRFNHIEAHFPSVREHKTRAHGAD